MELQEFLNLMERRERVVSDSEAHRFMSASAFEVMELTAKQRLPQLGRNSGAVLTNHR